MDSVQGDFAARLHDKLAANSAGNNLFFSPFSIRVALAMCAVGAKGETRQALIDLIGAPESVDEQNQHYGTLIKSVHGEGYRALQLVMANALWGQRGYRFNPDYSQVVADYYDAVFRELDFRESVDEAVSAVNTWVREKTGAKITSLIDRGTISADTRLILTNAIYFKGQWETVFDKSATKQEIWHSTPRTTVPMMHQNGSYLYYEDDSLQALNIPYRGRQLSLLVVLPRKNDALAVVESRWNARGIFRQVTQGLDPETVVVSLPCFKIAAEYLLKPALCALHAALIFSEEADFSGIGEEQLMISEVIHRSFVEVNEVGTEAAAATAVKMMLSTGTGSRSPEPKVFRADHPFLFFIWERKTSAVFFAGRFAGPERAA